MNYEKINSIVEAFQWTNSAGNFSHLLEWTGNRFRGASPLIWGQSGVKVGYTDGELQTPDGVVIVPLGSWIIKHTDGVFYPVSEGCFDKLYRPTMQEQTSSRRVKQK